MKKKESKEQSKNIYKWEKKIKIPVNLKTEKGNKEKREKRKKEKES